MMKLRESGYGGSENESEKILSDKVIPSIKMLIEMEENGGLSGGFFQGQRSAAFFISVESEAMLDDMLSQLPCSEIFDMDVVPLESLKEALSRDEKIAEGIRKANA